MLPRAPVGLAAVCRAYHLALRVLPPRFRGSYGAQMLTVFVDLAREAHERDQWRGSMRAFASELPGLVRLAVDEHRLEWRRRRDHRAEIRVAAHRESPIVLPHRSWSMIDTLRYDLRTAVRSLARYPGVTVVAIVSLALGIGANTAIFSVLNGVLLKPLGYPDAGRLVAIGEGREGGLPTMLNSTSPASFYDWEAGARTFSEMAAYSPTQNVLLGRGDPELVQGVNTVGGLFEVLDVRAAIGRTFSVAEEDPSAEAVVVLSHAMWTGMFGGDSAVVGTTINLGGRPRRVVGVMPAGFRFVSGRSLYWMPAQYAPDFRANRDQYFLGVIGRLRGDATIEEARTDLEMVASRLRADWSQFNTGLRLNVIPFQAALVSDSERPLYLLMGAVVLVLLVACANIGNLLLARGAARRREIAVRQALGAGRWRITRQLITESVVLGLAGGAAGVILGRMMLALLLRQEAIGLPRMEDITLDGRVLAFTFAVALVAGIAFGIVPALRLASPRATEALRSGTRTAGGDRWARRSLVVAELALAVVLLAGAGLLLRSFAHLQRVDPGFATDHLLTFNVSLRGAPPGFFPQSVERIAALPGVRAAAIVSQLPATGRGGGAWFNILDRPTPAGETPPGEAYRIISTGYFATAGIPLREGRLLTERDRLESSPSVVVNEALAKRYWPAGGAVGKEIYLGAPDNRLFPKATIVGIVGDTKDAGLAADPIPMVFIPLAMAPWGTSFAYMIRTTGDPALLAGPARAELRTLDANAPVRNVRTMEAVLAESLGPARWSMTLLSVFAALALVLACVGVFGVLTFTVAQRTRELGIMIALGAAPAAVRRLVVREAMALTLAGVIIGLGASAVATRAMAGMLFGVAGTDALTYAVVALVLIAVGALASFLPARRATQVSPLVALRSE